MVVSSPKETTNKQVPCTHKPFFPSSTLIPVIVLSSHIIMSLWKLLPYKAGWQIFPKANLVNVKVFSRWELWDNTTLASESWGRSSGRRSLFGGSSNSPLLSYGMGMICLWTGLQGDLAMLVPVCSASVLPTTWDCPGTLCQCSPSVSPVR